MQYSFENLHTWQKSIVLVKLVYQTTKKFPIEEKFGLISQLRRSAVSVSNNITEGNMRLNAKNQARFYEIAFGSLMETLNSFIIAKELNIIGDLEIASIRDLIEEISRMLLSLYKSAKKDQ